MRRYCPSDRHGGSRFRGFALAFTSLAKELASEITSFLTVDCFSNVLKTGCHKCACSMECSRNQVKGGLSCHADQERILKKGEGGRSAKHPRTLLKSQNFPMLHALLKIGITARYVAK